VLWDWATRTPLAAARLPTHASATAPTPTHVRFSPDASLLAIVTAAPAPHLLVLDHRRGFRVVACECLPPPPASRRGSRAGSGSGVIVADGGGADAVVGLCWIGSGGRGGMAASAAAAAESVAVTAAHSGGRGGTLLVCKAGGMVVLELGGRGVIAERVFSGVGADLRPDVAVGAERGVAAGGMVGYVLMSSGTLLVLDAAGRCVDHVPDCAGGAETFTTLVANGRAVLCGTASGAVHARSATNLRSHRELRLTSMAAGDDQVRVANRSAVAALACGARGRYLWCYLRNATSMVIDTTSGTVVHYARAQRGPVTSLEVSEATGGIATSSGLDQTVAFHTDPPSVSPRILHLCRLLSPNLFNGSAAGPSDAPLSVLCTATRAGGRVFAFGTDRGVVWLVDSRTGSLLSSFTAHGRGPVAHLAFSADGCHATCTEQDGRTVLMRATSSGPGTAWEPVLLLRKALADARAPGGVASTAAASRAALFVLPPDGPRAFYPPRSGGISAAARRGGPGGPAFGIGATGSPGLTTGAAPRSLHVALLATATHVVVHRLAPSTPGAGPGARGVPHPFAPQAHSLLQLAAPCVELAAHPSGEYLLALAADGGVEVLCLATGESRGTVRAGVTLPGGDPGDPAAARDPRRRGRHPVAVGLAVDASGLYVAVGFGLVAGSTF
jgi:hypothetical protein